MIIFNILQQTNNSNTTEEAIMVIAREQVEEVLHIHCVILITHVRHLQMLMVVFREKQWQLISFELNI